MPPPAHTSRRWSLAARLTAWYAATAFVLILATTSFLYWAVLTTLDHEDDQYLRDKARVLLSAWGAEPGDSRELRAEVERETGPRPGGQFLVRVFDGANRVVVASPGMARLRPEDFPEPGNLTSAKGAELDIPGAGYRVIAVRGDDGRVVHVAMDRSAEEDLLANYRWYTAVTLGAALIASSAVGYALARRGLQPLQDITTATRGVSSATLHERLDTAAWPAELGELAVNFNAMLDRLEDSFRRLDRFAADIAHELRTPVNNLRGEAEVALTRPRPADEYRDVLSSGLEELERLAGLIDNLLFLARAESPQARVSRQVLDVDRELETVRAFHEAAADEAGVTLAVNVTGDVSASLDRTLFQRAISNLVSNALAHTPRGGSVTLTAARGVDTVSVEVADTGGGIAPEHLPHVFDRFYRGDSARSSAGGSVGLGLALVKSIAALHGGSCAAESELGRGTRVRIVFPAAQLEIASTRALR